MFLEFSNWKNSKSWKKYKKKFFPRNSIRNMKRWSGGKTEGPEGFSPGEQSLPRKKWLSFWFKLKLKLLPLTYICDLTSFTDGTRSSSYVAYDRRVRDRGGGRGRRKTLPCFMNKRELTRVVTLGNENKDPGVQWSCPMKVIYLCQR